MKPSVIKSGVAVTFLFLSSILWLCLRTPGSGVPDVTAPIRVVIPPGASAAEVSRILSQAEVITSESWFLTLTKMLHSADRLKAGTYGFWPGESSLKVLRDIISGRTLRIKVTIPEGFTSQQIAERLESKGITGAKDFLEEVARRQAEGFLFPETYFFEPETPSSNIVETMIEEFEKRWTNQFEPRLQETGFTRKEIIVLASIVEKEARSEVEKPFVAGVFRNRLKKRWLLESCATVRYALNQWERKLTLADLKVNSPYNTYIHYRLPPGPICNPGEVSIRAALLPAKTDALFFLSDGKGSHHFYTSYEEHLKGKLQKRRNSRKKTLTNLF